MIESHRSTVGTLSQRTQIAASPDWQNLLTYFDLSGEGFAFIVLLVPDGEWAEACRQALERYLMAYRKKVVTVSFDSAEQFGMEMTSRLLSLHVDEGVGAVWVGAAVPEVSAEYEKWQAAWRVGVARLNQYRNPLRDQFNAPLLFVGAPWIQTTLREMAPDLWSVRTLVVRIESSAMSSEITISHPSSKQYRTTFAQGRAIDPDFALKEAEALRGQPGKEITLSRLLGRAGLGFRAHHRGDEAERAFKEALRLQYQFGEDKEDLANLLFDYADVLKMRNAYGQALSAVLEALALYRSIGDMLGEANSLLKLGDLAQNRSQYNEAQKYYEQALRIYPLIGEILGEANCLHSLGDLELSRSKYDKARERFEEALQLYKQIGEPLGEANCIQALAQIALSRTQLNEAQTRYEEALQLYRQIGGQLGEANCVIGLGEISLRHSDYDGARNYCEDALALYRQIGNILGEANSIFTLGRISAEQSKYDEAEKRYTEALPLFNRASDVLGEANCISGLGQIALRRSHYDEARVHFEEALPLYKRVRSVLGEAECIYGLGEIALEKKEDVTAQKLFATALELYRRIPEPYSIGWTHRQLARLAPDETERRQHIQAARAAWESIGFTNLVKELDEMFSTTQ
jgi:tetratricopeptide (TPR) repeat protein